MHRVSPPLRFVSHLQQCLTEVHSKSYVQGAGRRSGGHARLPEPHPKERYRGDSYSPRPHHSLQGLAGTGKTATLESIREGAEKSGFIVEGFAPTSRAARQLGGVKIDAGTL